MVVWSVVFATIASWAVSAVMPKTYRATTRLLVEDNEDLAAQIEAIHRLDELSRTSNWAHGSIMIWTTFERIQSKTVLYPVIEQLNLREKWGRKFRKQSPLTKEEAYALLKRRMDIKQLPDEKWKSARDTSSPGPSK